MHCERCHAARAVALQNLGRLDERRACVHEVVHNNAVHALHVAHELAGVILVDVVLADHKRERHELIDGALENVAELDSAIHRR